MGLSMACVIHCFFAPAVVILAYGVSAFTIESELIHYLLLMLAAPISLFALGLGYKKPSNYYFSCHRYSRVNNTYSCSSYRKYYWRVG